MTIKGIKNKEKPVLLSHTKEEIISVLKEENPVLTDDNYSQIFAILEFKKIRTNLGIIKGELYVNDIIEYRGSLIIPLSETIIDQKNIWNEIKVGKNKFYGLSLDLREMALKEKIISFFNRSLEEGKITDLIPIIKW